MESSTSVSRPASTVTNDPPPLTGFKKGSAFWLTFLAISVSTFLSAIDLTAVGTALPTITADLNGSDDFSWVGSAYALSSTAFLPLSGSLADIFGRRPVMMGSILFFAVGSALSGAAQNMNMLIAARTVQGIGGGGILNLTEIIVADLVPLAERGMYQGLIGLVWAMASGVGPPIGGAFAQKASWRWLFYMNLPLCGIAFGLVWIFLRVRTPEGSVMAKLARVDWTGNFIIVAGSALAITGLTFGGIRFPWDSAQVLAPLIIGVALIIFFLWYESKFPAEPSIPWEVVANMTSLSGYLGTFFQGIVSISAIYYLPVYFQAVLGASPIRSGVDALPIALVIAAFALTSGAVTQILKKYRPVNYAGWIMLVVGFGILSLLKGSSTTAQWVGYQLIAAGGMGLLFPGTVFPVLAPLDVERTASALAFFTFVRAFAQTWGITISATVLQNELKRKLPAAFAAQFPAGIEIAYAAIPYIRELQEPLRTEVRAAFADSMSVIWKTMIGISGLGLLSLLLMREIPMRVFTDERYGLHEKPKVADEEVAVSTVAVDGGEPKQVAS